MQRWDPVRYIGIDLAAQPRNTGVVVLTHRDGGWRAECPGGPASDDALVELLEPDDVVAVDCPLGWPIGFVAAVTAHSVYEDWPGTTDRSSLTHRLTDRLVAAAGYRRPLSVAADRLGIVAMRCALLQKRWNHEVWGGAADRDGSGPLVEAYPAAASHAWGLECAGYRREPEVRVSGCGALAEAVEWADLDMVADRCGASADVLDALLCAFVAVAVKAGATAGPDCSQRPVALVEGWIHVPESPLTELPCPQP